MSSTISHKENQFIRVMRNQQSNNNFSSFLNHFAWLCKIFSDHPLSSISCLRILQELKNNALQVPFPSFLCIFSINIEDNVQFGWKRGGREGKKKDLLIQNYQIFFFFVLFVIVFLARSFLNLIGNFLLQKNIALVFDE